MLLPSVMSDEELLYGMVESPDSKQTGLFQKLGQAVAQVLACLSLLRWSSVGQACHLFWLLKLASCRLTFCSRNTYGEVGLFVRKAPWDSPQASELGTAGSPQRSFSWRAICRQGLKEVRLLLRTSVNLPVPLRAISCPCQKAGHSALSPALW